jgi:hypothetical protein
MNEWNDETVDVLENFNSSKDVGNYRYLLKDLTYSSKPLLNVLTLCLKDIHPDSFSLVCEAIIEHFQSSDNIHKVPTLFLIDSVCKVLGPPWIQFFLDQHLDKAFVQVYLSLTSVEGKKEMQRTFLSWSTNLFPKEFLSSINTSLSSKKKSTASDNTNISRKRPSFDQGPNDIETTTDITNNKKLKLPRPATTTVASDLTVGDKSPESPTSSPFLDTAELSKILSSIKVISIENKLYGMPKQCANCGLRFPDTESGRQSHRLHLDGHYRRKARFRQRTKRVLARDWFPPGELWVQYSFLGNESQVEQEHGDKSAYFTTLKPPTKTESKDEEEDDEQVPAGENPQNTICTVCSEALHAVWDDDAEGWVFKASRLDSNGNPCHLACLQ